MKPTFTKIHKNSQLKVSDPVGKFGGGNNFLMLRNIY